MSKNIKGEWVKYEKEPGKWNSEESSYTRLCDDLKPYKYTGWSLGGFADYIYGEFIDVYGIGPSDVYIYYIVNEETGNRKPKLCMIADECEDGKMKVHIRGLKRGGKSSSILNYFYPKAKYLNVILDKLKEINAKDFDIEDIEEALVEYQKLLNIAKNGVKTNEDVLTIYKNLDRTDTFIARRLVIGRNVQNDYDSLDEDLKVKFIEILSFLSDKNLFDLAKLTEKPNISGLLVVSDINILRKAVVDKGLECLKFASIECLTSKELILEILSDFKINSIVSDKLFGIENISDDLQVDIDIICALTKTSPISIKEVFWLLNRKNPLFKEKLKDKDYMLKVLDMYFKNCISKESYRREKFISADIIGYFDTDMLENLENEILFGPFASLEEEQMKDKCSDQIRLVRSEIKEYERKYIIRK